MMIDMVMIRLGVRHPTERPESLGVWMLVLMVLWMRTKSLESDQRMRDRLQNNNQTIYCYCTIQSTKHCQTDLAFARTDEQST